MCWHLYNLFCSLTDWVTLRITSVYPQFWPKCTIFVIWNFELSHLDSESCLWLTIQDKPTCLLIILLFWVVSVSVSVSVFVKLNKNINKYWDGNAVWFTFGQKRKRSWLALYKLIIHYKSFQTVQALGISRSLLCKGSFTKSSSDFSFHSFTSPVPLHSRENCIYFLQIQKFGVLWRPLKNHIIPLLLSMQWRVDISIAFH